MSILVAKKNNGNSSVSSTACLDSHRKQHQSSALHALCEHNPQVAWYQAAKSPIIEDPDPVWYTN